jgi:putative membrane protein PagO
MPSLSRPRLLAPYVVVGVAALTALIVCETSLAGDADPLGVFALLGAAGLHATVYVLLRRDAGAISPLTLNALPMGHAGLLLCAASLAVHTARRAPAPARRARPLLRRALANS